MRINCVVFSHKLFGVVLICYLFLSVIRLLCDILFVMHDLVVLFFRFLFLLLAIGMCLLRC